MCSSPHVNSVARTPYPAMRAETRRAAQSPLIINNICDPEERLSKGSVREGKGVGGMCAQS